MKKKWKNKTNDYAYICDQLRSIRQDMMLQRIKNDFAVEVYETHARIALECRDISHFNQCQTQLVELYDAGFKGHQEEFLGYRIMYTGLHNMKLELMLILKKLSLKEKQNKAIKHALRVINALDNNNYRIVFKEYKSAPNMSAYLMDLFIDRLRVFALQTISIAYMMGVEIKLIADELGFDSIEQCTKFVTEAGGKINEKTGRLDSKESMKGFRASSILTKKII
jgi:hypothetical protein